MRDLSNLTAHQKQLLRDMADGSIMVGTLGKDPRSPNHRIFELSDGTVIQRHTTATSLLRRGLVKVISVDGPCTFYVITELGRLAVQSDGARGARRVAPGELR